MNKKFDLNNILEDKKIVRIINILGTNLVSAKILRRSILFLALFKRKKISLTVLRDFLPGNQNLNGSQELVTSQICTEKFFKLLRSKAPFSLYGKPIKYFSNEVLIFTANSIIRMDQYHAKEFIREDSVVLDVGSSCGLFSVFAAQIAKHGKIFAFEPSGVFKILAHNTILYPNIYPVNIGLSDKEEPKQMATYTYQHRNLMLDSLCYQNLGDHKRIENVQLTTIDNFILKNKIKKVNFIKIDAEGYEIKILNGAKKTIKKHQPVIVAAAYHNKNDIIKMTKLIKEIEPGYNFKISFINEKDLICIPPNRK